MLLSQRQLQIPFREHKSHSALYAAKRYYFRQFHVFGLCKKQLTNGLLSVKINSGKEIRMRLLPYQRSAYCNQIIMSGGKPMYYHASPVGGIIRLKPSFSDHGIPLVYFSEKRENVLVYLSNAVEKYCKETGFPYDGKYQNGGHTALTKTERSVWRNTTQTH